MIRLSLIGEEYPCVQALFDGTVRAEGIELAVTRSPSPEAMRRQLTAWEFDICEMAFGAYLIARAQGADVTLLPAFPRRAFFHTQFACRVAAGIDAPGALAGKRVGVPEYVQSATLWARGILERDFGLEPTKVTWYVERAGGQSTGEVLGFRPPAALDVRQTPGGKSIAAMLQAGELDAALAGALAQRPSAELAQSGLRPLFADPFAEAERFCRAHGYIPANHAYMIRASLVREHPKLAASLMQGFRDAAAHAQGALPRGAGPATHFGNDHFAQACAGLPSDLFGYGVDANRAMLETVLDMAQAQRMIAERPALSALFA
jgi:4,5-dihydroxyphthalate decarboxylase